jgi:cytochrome c oxidase cbb3-type subunit III
MTFPEPGTRFTTRKTALLVALCVSGTACQPQENQETQEQEHEAAGVEQTAGKADEPGQPGPAGTFTPREGAAADEQGRLPAEGDQSMRIAATELFPGAARFDPNIRNPYSGNERAIAAGERHFAAFNCAGCHAPMGGGGMGPPLSDDHWIYGSRPAQIYLSIMQGRPQGMPAWSSMLPRQTAWELVAYIETLDDVEDYAAEKGFASNRQEPAQAGDAATGEAGADESPPGQ